MEGHVRSDNFDAYTSASQHSYEHAGLAWELGMLQIAPGHAVPWDEQFVIESLSARPSTWPFTISYLIPGEDNFDGSRNGPIGISASEFNDKVWDFIFAEATTRKAAPSQRRSFCGFVGNLVLVPLDLRVSGKDLIRNHLTMALYNHAAI